MLMHRLSVRASSVRLRLPVRRNVCSVACPAAALRAPVGLSDRKHIGIGIA